MPCFEGDSEVARGVLRRFLHRARSWKPAGSATSMTTNFWFTNSVPAGDANFYRVIFP